MLEVKDVHKSYGDLEVLKGITFNMKKGSTKVIIGTSGTGKSTLLRCINQLNPPDKGEIWLNGEEITKPKIDINKIRQKIGFVFNILPHILINPFTHIHRPLAGQLGLFFKFDPFQLFRI